ncbi:MAG: hydrogenase maturation nickel metallochaperone HypA [Treponemataceae bacterium]|nr:hydrogenase maturation nickel metallochaperone HypA [Spirochaetales bacterium]MDY6031117.1 hydrogenase maturation nickel metallochaperone HypA [Treponemataceae bacterium]
MHELGIVFYIIKDVKEAAEQNNVKKINSVTMELGEVSTVIPYYLEDCWKWAVKKEGPLLNEAKLVIEQIPAVTYCEGCGKEYPTVANGKTCPYCKSDKTYLLRGNEVMIKEVEAVNSDDDELVGESEIEQESRGVSIDSGMKME